MNFQKSLWKAFIVVLSLGVVVSLQVSPSSANEIGGFFQTRPDYVSFSAGYSSSCAVTRSGEVWCWGANNKQQVFNRASQFELQPRKIEGLQEVKQVAVGKEHSCALVNSGRVVCWGSNEFSQLGTGFQAIDLPLSYFPEYVNGVTHAKQIEAGEFHTCAITIQEDLFCWGSNSRGQSGQLPRDESRQINGRSIIANAEPIKLKGVTDVSLGAEHTCASTKEGFVFCWGSNLYGQLGVGWNIESTYSPTQVSTLTSIVEIDAAGDSSCAKSQKNLLRCWGRGGNGQLGTLDTSDIALPSNVSLSLSSFAVDKFSVGYRSTCARLDNSVLYCWGSNQFAQVGTANVETNSIIPFATIQLPFPDVVYVDSGSDFSCALTSEIWCWGRNDLGQLGRNMVGASGTYAKLVNTRWALSTGSISHKNLENTVTLTWPTVGDKQTFARVEDDKGNLLCRTVTALSCDFVVSNLGPMKIILYLRTDVDGISESVRAEYLFNVTSVTSAAQSKQDSDIKATYSELTKKLNADEAAKYANRLLSLNQRLESIIELQNKAIDRANEKDDQSMIALKSLNQSQSRIVLALQKLELSVQSLLMTLKETSNLLAKLSRLKS